MTLCSPQLQKFLLIKICSKYACNKASKKNIIVKGGEKRRICSTIAIDAPSSLASVSGIKWCSVRLKGPREEMEDDVVIIETDDGLDGFSYAAVFDGHAGFSSVEFLRFVILMLSVCCFCFRFGGCLNEGLARIESEGVKEIDIFFYRCEEKKTIWRKGLSELGASKN